MNQWWNNATIERFKARTKCMVDQYSQYDVGNLTVNGRQTLGEPYISRGVSGDAGLECVYGQSYLVSKDAHCSHRESIDNFYGLSVTNC